MVILGLIYRQVPGTATLIRGAQSAYGRQGLEQVSVIAGVAHVRAATRGAYGAAGAGVVNGGRVSSM